MQKLGFRATVKEIDVDCDNPPFFGAVKLS